MLLRGIIFLFSVFYLSVSFVSGQDHDHVHGEGEQCGFDILLRKNPEAVRDFNEKMASALLHKQIREKHLRETLGEAYDLLQEPEYTVPVVIHVLHRRTEAVGGETNVGKRFIDNMIVELNEYFSATQPNRIIPPQYESVDAGDTGIRFALARRDPADLPTDGIVRVPLPAGTGFLDDLTADAAQISPTWNRFRYLNIWVVPRENLTSPEGSILGAANFPYSPHLSGLGRGTVNASSGGLIGGSGIATHDGIIMRSSLVGGGSPNTQVDRPKTHVHEVGHYLGLFHPWSGGVSVFEPLGFCNVDDGCADTPRISQATRIQGGRPCEGIPSCLRGDDVPFPMTQNYMDYSPDRCQQMFTQCQRHRMRTVLESTTFRRTLWEGNDALTPVDDALLQLQNNVGFTSSGTFHANCANRFTFEDVGIANYGANPVSSIDVQFFIGDTEHGSLITIDFSPPLASHARMTLFEEGSGDEVTIPIPSDLYEGELFLRIVNVNGVEDTSDDYGRNTYTVDVDRERVESGVPTLEFLVNSDGDDDINFSAEAGYDNAFSVETGSNGNKLLRIHRTLESAADGHSAASLVSPYVSVSEILNEGGGDYALGVRLRYSYVANDLSEGDRLLLVLFDCQDENFVPFGGTDLDVATSHYPEGGEVPHERTFRDIHLPLPISRDGRVTSYDVFTTERRLSDSVQAVLIVWNGGGSDLFIENFEFTRTLNSDLPSLDFGVVGTFHDPYVCETDEVIPNVIYLFRYANYGKVNWVWRKFLFIDQGRGIELFTYHEGGTFGADTPHQIEGRELGSPLYEGSSLSFESKPLFVVEGFNRHLVSINDSRPNRETNLDNNTLEYSQYYTKKDPEPLSTAGVTETFSSDNLVWVPDFVGVGTEGGWVRNSEGSYMELRFSDAVTQKDSYYRLISRRFDFSGVSGGEFTFRVAYSGTDTQNDILRVYAVRRCGVSAGALLYEKSGTALSTSTSTDIQWSPSSASDWREEVVDLTPVAGHDDIFILIVGIKGSDEGRTIHIDDLSFDGSSGGGSGGSVVGVPLASSQDVVLYPNPVEDGVVSLDVSPLLYSSARVRIIDFSGTVAWEDTFSRLNERFLRFRPNIARGQAYILHVESGDYSQKLRFLY